MSWRKKDANGLDPLPRGRSLTIKSGKPPTRMRVTPLMKRIIEYQKAILRPWWYAEVNSRRHPLVFGDNDLLDGNTNKYIPLLIRVVMADFEVKGVLVYRPGELGRRHVPWFIDKVPWSTWRWDFMLLWVLPYSFFMHIIWMFKCLNWFDC